MQPEILEPATDTSAEQGNIIQLRPRHHGLVSNIRQPIMIGRQCSCHLQILDGLEEIPDQYIFHHQVIRNDFLNRSGVVEDNGLRKTYYLINSDGKTIAYVYDGMTVSQAINDRNTIKTNTPVSFVVETVEAKMPLKSIFLRALACIIGLRNAKTWTMTHVNVLHPPEGYTMNKFNREILHPPQFTEPPAAS